MRRELLDNGNIWQKSDGRWIGTVRYKDEFGEAQRKNFSAKKKKDLQVKINKYVETKELEDIDNYIVPCSLNDKQGILGSFKIGLDKYNEEMNKNK